MKRWMIWLAVACLCGCSSIDMPSGTSKGYSSARFIQPKPQPFAAADPSAELNLRIQQSIAKEFEAHGLAVAAGDADLVIAYLVILQDNVMTTRLDDYYGYGQDAADIMDEAHKRGVVQNSRREAFARGAIVIDLVDAKSGRLVYRDYAVRDVWANVSEEDRQARIEEAVRQALAGFFR